jgi:hypothetical protein
MNEANHYDFLFLFLFLSLLVLTLLHESNICEIFLYIEIIGLNIMGYR